MMIAVEAAVAVVEVQRERGRRGQGNEKKIKGKC
jgi:hypothetical protein